jgi:hypothetical protein
MAATVLVDFESNPKTRTAGDPVHRESNPKTRTAGDPFHRNRRATRRHALRATPFIATIGHGCNGFGRLRAPVLGPPIGTGNICRP